jgi:hypothetical protein
MSKQIDKPFGQWTLTQEDLKKFRWWLTYDSIHMPEPFTPLAGWILCYLENQAFFYAPEKIKFPASKGACFKISEEGYTAISEPIISTPEETEERAKSFKDNLKFYMGNFEKIWGDFEWRGKVGIYLEEIQKIFAEIGTFDPETWCFNREKFFSKLESLSNGQLYGLFFDSLEKIRRVWEIHFELMYIDFAIRLSFESLCNELLGIMISTPLLKNCFKDLTT